MSSWGKYHREFFANGIEWIANQDPHATSSAIALSSKFGEEIETPEIAGRHHLFEHLFFRASSMKQTIRAVKQQDKKGIVTQGASLNQMVYVYGKTSLDQLPAAAALLSNMLHTVPDIPQICVERDVLYHEEKKRVYDPELLVERRALSALFPGMRHTMDAEELLSRIAQLDPHQAQEHYVNMLCPSRLLLVTLSDKPPEKVRKALQPFENLPKASFPTPPKASYPERTNYVLDEVFPLTPICYVSTMLRMFPADETKNRVRDLAVAWVAGRMIATADSSTLYREQRLLRGSSYSPNCTVHLDRPELRLQIDYTCEEKHLDQNRAVVQRVLESMADGGRFSGTLGVENLLSPHRVAEAREVAFMEFNSDLSDTDSRIDFLCGNAALGYFVKPATFAKYLDSVTPGDVRRLMREILPGTTTAILRPENRPYKTRPYAANGHAATSQKS